MSSANSDLFSQGESSVPPSFNLQAQSGLAEILQMCCLSRRTGQLTFRSEESGGFVYLQHGRVIHAVCGSVVGEEAVYRMLGWAPGRFSLNEDILPQEKTVTSTWEQLIFEGARRADKSQENPLKSATGPVVTSAPATSRRVKSLPKITVILPDERPRVYELEAEYTHVGRASGNEIPVSDLAVSNRHCIFILNGSDVIVRDLNSSNGTVVNGQTISEAVLRPGDVIQIGGVQMKFEPAVHRPKLSQSFTAKFGKTSDLSEVTSHPPSASTIKLPQARPSTPATPPKQVEDDTVFVKGESAISYENLPKPEVPSKGRPVLLILVGGFVVLLILGVAYYYFMFATH